LPGLFIVAALLQHSRSLVLAIVADGEADVICSERLQRRYGLTLMIAACGLERSRVPTFLYRCPKTAQTVQCWIADDPTKDRVDADAYETIECLACGGLHLVRPATGQVLGQQQD
jgi:hypothetical protein